MSPKVLYCTFTQHTILHRYELVCYGCKSRKEMTLLLEEEQEDLSYKVVPGPFQEFPSSILQAGVVS